MRKLSKFLLSLMIIGMLATPAHAKVITNDQGTITIAEDEIVNDDLYLAAETVEILGTVNGDVYVGAGVVRFSGNITGDLLIGAGEVKISGEVGDDLWIGAGNVYLTGAKVGDGVNIGAGSVTIDDDSTIGGSLLAGTGMLDSDAPVTRNVMIGSGLARLDGPIGGELRVGAETIELGAKTLVAGDFTYTSESEPTLAIGATITGETFKFTPTTPVKTDNKWKEDMRVLHGRMSTIFNIVSFLGAMLVGLVTLWLLKKPTLAIAKTIEQNFLSSLGWGLLILVLAGPALILLAITGIGMPLAMLLGLLLIIDLCLAKIWASMTAGLVLQKQFGWTKMKAGAVFAIGLTLYYALRMIPLVGMFVRLTALLSGLGGVWIYLKSLKK